MYPRSISGVSIGMFMVMVFLISPSMAHAAPLLYLATATGGALLALASLLTGPGIVSVAPTIMRAAEVASATSAQ